MKAFVLAFLLIGQTEPASAPASTLAQLYLGLSRCLHAPASTTPFEMTLVFSLKRDGSLLGKPRITHAALRGDIDQQKTIVGEVLTALSVCLPVNITDGLGGAIAGRPLYFRIRSGPRETDT